MSKQEQLPSETYTWAPDAQGAKDGPGMLTAEQSAAPERERCRTHNHVRDTWTECRTCRGDGEIYSESDYEDDWPSGYYRCYSCGDAGGYYECFLCLLEEGDDY